MIGGWAALAWIAGTAGAAPPPALDVAVRAPWEVVQQDDDSLALRLADTADGVRVTWRADDRGRVPGVTPVWDGVGMETPEAGRLWPLFAVAFPDHPVQKVAVEVQGVDLVVRLYGPPLDRVTAHPDAPADPVLTWVRVRRRPDDWRLVVDGLTTISLPAEGIAVHPADDGEVALLAGDRGRFVFSPEAPAWRSILGTSRWSWSNTASADAAQPYPRTGITWRAASP